MGSEFAIEYASAKVPKPIAAITAADRITPVILDKIVLQLNYLAFLLANLTLLNIEIAERRINARNAIAVK